MLEDPGISKLDQNERNLLMKRCRFFFLIVLLPIMMLSGCNPSTHSDTLSISSQVEDVNYHAEILYEGATDLQGIRQDNGEIWLYRYGEKALFNANLIPGDFIDCREEEPLFKVCEDDGATFCIHPDEGILRNGKTLSLPEDTAFYNPLGFWELDGMRYLVASRTLHDNQEADVVLSRETMLFPLGKVLGTPVSVKFSGESSSPTFMTFGGGWNYWVENGDLFRTDGYKTHRLGNLSGFGITSLNGLFILGDELLVLSGPRLFHLSPGIGYTESNSVNPIRIGVVDSSRNMRELVAAYNREQGGQIEIIVYDDDTDLNLAVLSGDVDMVASFFGDTLTNFAKQGYLVPMEDIIGEVLQEGDIYPNILEALEQNGILYVLPDAIKVHGMALPSSIIAQYGEPESIEELIALLHKMENQNFFKQTEKEIVFTQFLFHGLTKWVDLDANQACFDSESYIALLELANQYAKDYDETEANQDGMPMLFQPLYTVSNPEQLGLDMLYEMKGTEKPSTGHGLSADLIPFPNGPDEGFAFKAMVLYGVLNSSANQASCEAFLRWMISESTQNKIMEFSLEEEYDGISIRKSAMQKLIDSERSSPDPKEQKIENMNQIIKIIEEADHLDINYCMQIANIALEEGKRYFSGSITASQAADYTQNRVSIFLAEQS
ncbi:MAG: carbohydrate ABC transporter substrate-binding protein [Clostridia bacterium]|nr:carbohydrate ABC transporter substrate-binding protein [Clostridia bacterium]